MQEQYCKAIRGMALCWLGAVIAIPAIAQTTTVAGHTPGQFSVNESGAATYRIPVQVPPGVAGMEPKLELAYNSQAANGLLGMGWSLGGLSAISRCPRTMAQDGVRGAVNFDMNDRYCMDGQRLILVSGTYGVAGSEYRTELDSFSKIVAPGTAGNGVASFTVQTKAGLTMEYGNTADSRVEAQGKTSVRVWAINKISDVKTNFMTFSYIEDNANGDFYPSRIDYAGNTNAGKAPANSVRFIYETRPDVATAYQAGAIIRSSSRLKELQVYEGASAIRNYRAGFDLSVATKRSRLVSLQECATGGMCLFPISIAHTPAAHVVFSRSIDVAGWGAGSSFTDSNIYPVIIGDWNGDGKTDWARVQGSAISFLVSTGTGFERIADVAGWGPGSGLTDGNIYPIITGDWNGDGKTDWARVQSGAVSFYVSTGTGFERIADVAGWGPGSGLTDGNIYPIITGDWNGDGKTDWARVQSGAVSFYASTGTGFERIADVAGWGPGSGFTDGNIYPIITGDWNGDGKTDWARVQSESISFFISTGSGFERMPDVPGWGPGVGFSNGSVYPIFTGDWNGDGKTDWARVQSESISFFISTGSGFERISDVPGWGPGVGFSNGGVYPIITGDWNGDGKTDWARVQSESVSFFVSTGSGFERIPDVPGWGPGVGFSNGGVYPLITGDWNGDGKTDWARFQSATVSFFTENNPIPDLASEISRQGSVVQLTTQPLTNSAVYTKDIAPNASAYPKLDLQYPQYVVSSVASSNGVGGMVTTQYNYGGLKAEQNTGRGMLGFRWMKSKNLSNNIESYTEFNQNWPLTGTVAKSETRLAGSGNTGVLKRTTNTYVQAAGSVVGTTFVYPGQSIEESWDLGGSAYPTVTNAYQYGQSPQYGDPTQISVSNSAGAGKTTVNEYWPANTGSGNWILGRLKKATVSSVTP
ncbi:FG-GAP-like repeat-containing protein [Polaromonas sp. LjRoot131]|uniref:FG-GAP-like repeat-containing protein n=1 Tax=Polaromonas sp. LjRoot131 TaxID=3342262 RepID=UPI003ED10DBF